MSQNNETKFEKTIMDIMTRLREATVFERDLQHADVTDFPEFESGRDYRSFRNKIMKKLHRRKKQYSWIALQRFDWKQVEMENPTGKELLRLIIALYSDKELAVEGNCIVLNANNVPTFAITKIFRDAWECTSPPIEEQSANQKYYDKIYDENKCKRETRERQKYKQYYTSKCLKEIRDQVQQKFEDFLLDPVKICDEKFRNPFFGVLCEIAKHETRNDAIYEDLKQIPVAGCVFRATCERLTHKLQAVFGDHCLPVDDWKKEYQTEYLQQPHGEKGYIVEKKFEGRYKAAAEIVKISFNVKEDGNYDIEKLRGAINELEGYFTTSV